MNLVDTSGWLEYFTLGSNALFFEPALLDKPRLIVSTISIYEVFKVVARERGEATAQQICATMSGASIVPVTDTIALAAEEISAMHKLPMADSLIYASALERQATLWTQDVHFSNLPNVKYIAKVYTTTPETPK